MRAGSLDSRIVFQSPTVDRLALGGNETTWSDEREDWAAAVHLRGQELLAAQQVAGEEIVVFTVRWFDGSSVTWRIVHDNRNYDIFSIAPIGRCEGLRITARANRE